MALVIVLLLAVTAIAAAGATAWGWHSRDISLFAYGTFWLSILSGGLAAKLLEPAAKRLEEKLKYD